MRGISFINQHSKKIVTGLIIIGILSFGTLITFSFYPKRTIQGTVIEKLGSGLDRNTNRGRIIIQKSTGKKLMLANDDNWLSGKSGKVIEFQQDLKVGKTYEFKIVGGSIPILGQHPNIINYKLIKNGAR